MTIREQVEKEKTDIYTFLAAKYNIPRAEVKVLVRYVYRSNLSENDKFKTPRVPYAKMINDFIDYTLNKTEYETKRNHRTSESL